MKRKNIVVIALALALPTVASSAELSVTRTLDYKSHVVRCTIYSNQVIVEKTSLTPFVDRTKKYGRFFNPIEGARYIAGAERERFTEWTHVRESLPNVTIEAAGVLILHSAGRTLTRVGYYSDGIKRLVARACGPYAQD